MRGKPIRKRKRLPRKQLEAELVKQAAMRKLQELVDENFAPALTNRRVALSSSQAFLL
ncbi:MAG TPA: hypothetical protein VII08_10850 [Myxococcales bacterium]